MDSFGKKLKDCRNENKISQSELARMLNTNHSIIGKYERDEVKPTIDVVKRLAEALDTTVGYLLGETQDVNLLKDPKMLQRFNDVNDLPDEEKKCVFSLMDAYLANHKMKTLLS